MKAQSPEWVYRRSPNVVSVGDVFWLGILSWRITQVHPTVEFDQAVPR